MVINIAGLQIDIRYFSNNIAIFNRLAESYKECMSEKASDFHIDIDILQEENFTINFPTQGSRTIPFVAREGKEKLAFVCSNASATINLKKPNAQIFISSNNSEETICQLINVMIRNLVNFWLMQDSRLLLHACGIKTDCGAVLFSGPSESGKSTVAQLSEPRVILSDETLVIKVEEKYCITCGTPWYGTVDRWMDITQEVEGVFFLEKAPQTYSVELRRQEAMVFLIKNSFIPFGYEKFLPTIAAICYNIVHMTPCYRLYFTPTPDIWKCIEATLPAVLNRREVN